MIELGLQKPAQNCRKGRSGRKAHFSQIASTYVRRHAAPGGDVAGESAPDFGPVVHGHDIEHAFERQLCQKGADLAWPWLARGKELLQWALQGAHVFAALHDSVLGSGRKSQAPEAGQGVVVAHGTCEYEEVDKPGAYLHVEIEQSEPAEYPGHFGQIPGPCRIEGKLRVQVLQNAEFLQAIDGRQGPLLTADMLEFVEDARRGELVQKAHGKGVAHKLFRGRPEAEVVALLEAHGPQDTGRILHEAQGVEHAYDPVLQIALAAKKVHHLAHGLAVQPYSQGVDGKVPAVEVHLDAAVLDSGHGSRGLVVFEPGRSHVHALFPALFVRVEHNTREKLLVFAHPAVQTLGKGSRKAKAVALDNKVYVLVRGLEHEVANKAPHHIHRCGKLAPELGSKGQKMQDVGWQLVAQGLAHIPTLGLALLVLVHAARLCSEDADEIRTGDNAKDDVFLPVQDGHKALVRAHDDRGEILQGGVHGKGLHGFHHVVVDLFLAQAMGHGALSRDTVYEPHALPCSPCKDGDAFEREVEHELVRLGYGASFLHAHCRRGHVVAGLVLACLLQIEGVQDGVVHLGKALVAYAGRGRVDMAAAAKAGAHGSHVDGRRTGPCHHLDAVVHAAYGKEHSELFHLHELVRKIGKVPEIVLERRVRQHHLLVVDLVGFQGLYHAVERLHVGAGHLEGQGVVDDIYVHALAHEPGCSLVVLGRSGGIGKGTGVGVEAHAEHGGCPGRYLHHLVLHAGDEQGDRGTGVCKVCEVRVNVVACVRMVVPDLHADAGIVQKGPDVVQARALPCVHHYEEAVAGEVRVAVHKAAALEQIGVLAYLLVELVEILFLASRVEQIAGRVEPACSQHGREGIKVRVGVAGYQGLGAKFWVWQAHVLVLGW